MIATEILVLSAIGKKLGVPKKCIKTAKNAKNRRIQLKYRANNFGNGFIGLPVPQNPMIEPRILNLSPIGKKLA